MGRKTFTSFPKKNGNPAPLPKRLNLVITTSALTVYEHACVDYLNFLSTENISKSPVVDLGENNLTNLTQKPLHEDDKSNYASEAYKPELASSNIGFKGIPNSNRNLWFIPSYVSGIYLAKLLYLLKLTLGNIAVLPSSTIVTSDNTSENSSKHTQNTLPTNSAKILPETKLFFHKLASWLAKSISKILPGEIIQQLANVKLNSLKQTSNKSIQVQFTDRLINDLVHKSLV